FSSRRRHTRFSRDWSSDVCSSDLIEKPGDLAGMLTDLQRHQVLFVDEIHRMSPAIEEILYPALEDYELDIVIGQGPSARSVKVRSEERRVGKAWGCR